jgi:hypothetical protein
VYVFLTLFFSEVASSAVHESVSVAGEREMRMQIRRRSIAYVVFFARSLPRARVDLTACLDECHVHNASFPATLRLALGAVSHPDVGSIATV